MAHTNSDTGSKIELVAAATLVALNRALLGSGLRRRIDGWRRAVGLVLRGEESTFVLSAFGLDTWSDEPSLASGDIEGTQAHAAARLHRFLSADRACHIRIRKSAQEDRAEQADGPAYKLAFEPWIDGPARFLSPVQWTRGESETVGAAADCVPLFNIVCRVGERGACDIWLRINHVGTDGVPMQELLSRLEANWSARAPVVYPTPEQFEPFTTPRSLPGREGLAQVQTFLDFGPLLAWRKQENARLPEPMTVAAAVQWRLSHHPAFASLHFGSTVEVAPNGGLDAGVGVVVVRPADYAVRPNGLAEFVRDFNRQIESNQTRSSIGCKTLDAAALIPARLARTLLRYALEQDPRAFGAIALTVLRDAKVFGAPIAEVGHDRGFIALGSIALPTSDGRKVGCATIKGPADVIANYPALLSAALKG